MNPRIKLVIVCGPDLGHDQALFYSRDHDFIPYEKNKSNFYFFPEADLGYQRYRDAVSDMLEEVKDTDRFVLIHTRYLEPAINGLVEVAYETACKERAKVMDHDQVEVHLFRPEEGWTVHHLDSELRLDNEWPFGIFWG